MDQFVLGLALRVIESQEWVHSGVCVCDVGFIEELLKVGVVGITSGFLRIFGFRP